MDRHWERVRKTVNRGLRWFSRPKVRRVITIALTLMAVTSLALLFRANWDTLRDWEWEIHPFPLFLSFCIYTAALALAIFLWGQIMNNLGLPVPWRQHIRIYCTTNLARRIPGILWHVVGRLALYDPNRTSKAVISVSSGLELVLSGLSGLIIGVIMWPDATSRAIQPFWIVAIIVSGLVLIHPRVLRALLKTLGYQQVSQTPLRYTHILGWLFLYSIIWLLGGCVLFTLIQTISPISLVHLPQTIGAWGLSGAIAVIVSFLPFALGLRELTLGLLLASFMPTGVALVIAVLSRLQLTIYELVWMLVTQLVQKQA